MMLALSVQLSVVTPSVSRLLKVPSRFVGAWLVLQPHWKAGVTPARERITSVDAVNGWPIVYCSASADVVTLSTPPAVDC